MPCEFRLTRRMLTTMALTLPWLSGGEAYAAAGGIVSLDYGLASTLLALGVTPAAVAARADWHRWVVEPPMPQGVADLGAMSEINFEVLARLKPSLILSTPFLAALRPRLESIAPVREFGIYAGGREALPTSFDVTRDLGALLGRERQAADFLTRAETVFTDCRHRIEKLPPAPVALVTLLDERHARIYGGPGLYQGTLNRLGLTNAWQGQSNVWGFHTIALEELIALPAETHLMIFEPLIPADILGRLDQNPLWRELPFVRAGRLSVLPGVLMFGMVCEAMRFAGLITQRLEQSA